MNAAAPRSTAGTDADTVAYMERGTRLVPWILVLAALASWIAAAFDIPRLAAPLGGRGLESSVGLGLFLNAATLWLWGTSSSSAASSSGRVMAARLVAFALAVLGVMGVVEDILSTRALSADATTSLVFVAVGIGFALFDARIGTARVAEIAGLAAFAAFLTTGFDWVLGFFVDEAATAIATVSAAAAEPAHVSPYTLLVTIPAVSSLFSARPREGWMAVITGASATSREAHRLVRLLPIIVAIVTLLRFLGEVNGLYDSRYGVSLMVGAMSFILIVAVWRTLGALQAADVETQRGRAVLDAIIENIPHMIFVKDSKELRFLRFNAAGERLLGMKRGELIGKNDFDFFPKEQAELFQAKDRTTLESGELVDIVEEEIDTKNGKRWLHTIKVPVSLTANNDAFLLGISEDITERKRVADELRSAKEAAEATSKELEAFSYSVSHDLRAPLRSIDGFSLAVMEDAGDKLDDESKKNLERVRAAAQKMATLIDDLLNLSRVSRQPLRQEHVDLSAIAKGIVDQLRRSDPDRSVEIVIAPGMAATGDPWLVEVMLQNLLGNAWKFTGKKPTAHIEVGMEHVDGEQRFFVKDDGAGFDMAYANKLFGAFQRLHAATDYPGTGIGLATVKRIAARHGGEMWAEGAVDQGARFTFRLGPAAAGSNLNAT